MKGQVTAPLVVSMASSHIFKIMFVNQGKVYEVYARKVGQGRLFGFIEVEECGWGGAPRSEFRRFQCSPGR